MPDENLTKNESQNDLPLFWDTDTSEKKDKKISSQKDFFEVTKDKQEKEREKPRAVLPEPKQAEIETKLISPKEKTLEILGPTQAEHSQTEKKGIKDSQIFILPEIKGSLNEQLLDARGSIRMSIQEVSEKTKVSKDFILALEVGNFSELPEPVYVRTYIKQLCKLYGTSYNDMLKEYDKILSLENKTKPLNKKDDIIGNMNKQSIDLRKFVYATILFVSIILLAFSGYKFANKKGYFTNKKISIQKVGQTQSIDDLMKYLPKLKLKERMLRVPAHSK